MRNVADPGPVSPPDRPGPCQTPLGHVSLFSSGERQADLAVLLGVRGDIVLSTMNSRIANQACNCRPGCNRGHHVWGTNQSLSLSGLPSIGHNCSIAASQPSVPEVREERKGQCKAARPRVKEGTCRYEALLTCIHALPMQSKIPRMQAIVSDARLLSCSHHCMQHASRSCAPPPDLDIMFDCRGLKG